MLQNEENSFLQRQSPKICFIPPDMFTDKQKKDRVDFFYSVDKDPNPTPVCPPVSQQTITQ